MNNNVSEINETTLNDTVCNVSHKANSYYENGSGGAIFCEKSTLNIDGDSTFVNNIARHSGGTIATTSESTVIIHGFNLFDRNFAEFAGGALALSSTKLLTHGSACLSNKQQS